MDFETAIAQYIGRSVEVFMTNDFIQGTLLGVGNGVLTVNAVSSSYSSVTGPVSVLIPNTEFVRVLA
ncbi:hypothetical protein [Cohnella massiliensis]|uniref:hypothetical protein n=1 Tax=Cohnella massiliensis TaxID=1816691 RepID=UPI0009B9DA82|nr:hypothetical protein [Cohnella massiliensis]